MTRCFKLLICAMAFTASTAASDTTDPVTLKAVLEQKWTELTVSEIIDQGCVAPIYVGVRLTRTQTGLSIASWQQDQREERVGTPSEFNSKRLAEFLDAVVSHYAAAVASDDIHEQMARLTTEDERKDAWARVIKAAGGLPVGGFGAKGVDIRLTVEGRKQRFADNYGADGFDQLQKWLTDHGAKYRH